MQTDVRWLRRFACDYHLKNSRMRENQNTEAIALSYLFKSQSQTPPPPTQLIPATLAA